MPQINLINGAYQHESVSTNNQRCLNAYPSLPGPDGRGKATLLQRAGKQELTTIAGDPEIRGMLAVQNTLYVVAANKLWAFVIDPDTGTVTSSSNVGTLSGFSGTVQMAANTTQVIIVDGNANNGWLYIPLNTVSITIGPIGGTALDTYSLTLQGTAIYTAENVATALTASQVIAKINLSTGTHGITASSGGTGVITLTAADNSSIVVTESGTGFTAGTDGLTIAGQELSTGTATAFRSITDADFLGGTDVAFLDGYFFLAEPGTNRFYCSSINDGRVYDGADFATAEINNDPIVSLAVKNRELWIFKENYIEVWYDAANNSGMPLSPRVGSELSIGCIAGDSVVSIDNTLYWLDNRGFVVSAVSSDAITNQTTGNVAQIVSTDALHAEWRTYSTISDAIAIGYVERGHLMYQINFPTEKRSWVYDLTTGVWHERSLFDAAYSTHIADRASFAAQIGLLNIVSGPLTTGIIYLSDVSYKDDDGTPIQCIRSTQHISQDFMLMEISSLELRCNVGTAPVTGDGSDPYISMRYSNDGGRTWSAALIESLGLTGEYSTRVGWNRLGTGVEWMFEFTIVAPIDWSIVDASITLGEVERF